MIVITGATGFIGSCLVEHFNHITQEDIIVVDNFSNPEKANNLKDKTISQYIDRDRFFEWMETNGQRVTFVLHIGARTDTTEFDKSIFDRLNEDFSQKVWTMCVQFSIPLIYASSAATYGLGEHGYKDDHHLIDKLQPLNLYGESKNNFDKWVLNQPEHPPFWAGLKFFNVYGPNEYHKKRMASVVFHAYQQLLTIRNITLFRSHRSDFRDGEQLRDFIYVKDILNVCEFLYKKRPENGIYNLGTGKARTFIDLAKSIFHEMNLNERITFVDTPTDIREKYQYYTQADMTKLINQGYTQPFFSLEEGVHDYVQNYLKTSAYY